MNNLLATSTKLCIFVYHLTLKTISHVNRPNCNRNRNGLDFRPYLFIHLKNSYKMKKALSTIWLIIYTILAFAPILFLGYLLGIKLMEN